MKQKQSRGRFIHGSENLIKLKGFHLLLTIRFNKSSKLSDGNQSEIQLEIIKIQNNIHLKSVVKKQYGNIHKQFPILTSVAQKILAFFGSTYLSESAFSNMTYIKNKLRNKITNDPLGSMLAISYTSSYQPDNESISK